jgi:uncharacterized protein (DUF58 family)
LLQHSSTLPHFRIALPQGQWVSLLHSKINPDIGPITMLTTTASLANRYLSGVCGTDRFAQVIRVLDPDPRDPCAVGYRSGLRRAKTVDLAQSELAGISGIVSQLSKAQIAACYVVLWPYRARMKLITEYIADAVNFERLAAVETNPEVRAQLEKQAAAYRRLAAQRAKQIGVPAPEWPNEKLP